MFPFLRISNHFSVFVCSLSLSAQGNNMPWQLQLLVIFLSVHIRRPEGSDVLGSSPAFSFPRLETEVLNVINTIILRLKSLYSELTLNGLLWDVLPCLCVTIIKTPWNLFEGYFWFWVRHWMFVDFIRVTWFFLLAKNSGKGWTCNLNFFSMKREKNTNVSRF